MQWKIFRHNLEKASTDNPTLLLKAWHKATSLSVSRGTGKFIRSLRCFDFIRMAFVTYGTFHRPLANEIILIYKKI